MEIKPCALHDLSDAKFHFATCRAPTLPDRTILIIEFEGDAERGATLTFMDAIIAAGKIAWQPGFLILDLRNLKYEWGDLMGRTISDASHDSYDNHIPVAIIVSDLNRTGLTSLIRDELFSDPRKRLFESIEDAVRSFES